MFFSLLSNLLRMDAQFTRQRLIAQLMFLNKEIISIYEWDEPNHTLVMNRETFTTKCWKKGESSVWHCSVKASIQFVKHTVMKSLTKIIFLFQNSKKYIFLICVMLYFFWCTEEEYKVWSSTYSCFRRYLEVFYPHSFHIQISHDIFSFVI